jgi:hypothetical protein
VQGSLGFSPFQANQVSHLEAPQHTRHWPSAGSCVWVPCVFSEEEKNDYKILVLEEQSQLVYMRVFLYFPYGSKFLNQPSITT